MAAPRCRTLSPVSRAVTEAPPASPLAKCGDQAQEAARNDGGGEAEAGDRADERHQGLLADQSGRDPARGPRNPVRQYKPPAWAARSASGGGAPGAEGWAAAGAE